MILYTTCAFDAEFLNKILMYSILTIATGATKRRLKAFDERVIEILTIHNSPAFFVCYSSKEALICKHADRSNLTIEQRFFKTTAIKSILDKLIIKKIVINSSNNGKLTAVVLLNDDSLYIYEADASRNAEGYASINLVKHIHPVERRDKWKYYKDKYEEKSFRKKKDSDPAKRTSIEVRGQAPSFDIYISFVRLSK